ncbi:ankyrin repeat domain-containing protein [Marinomonas ostreistagni]|uniref:Ankyrin repeat domain-containing protein n=1 Tax=Marinomonas ostreistagni TaxID=359209 RepID=A0ABS0ZEI7_9GAMM|nr:ankyrin repeat domain-containing protein [Marinomonas ostreistagni]MBJ7552055.1 ankyrin repeat domain-containing protein [Marinomonas ostreistagni]
MSSTDSSAHEMQEKLQQLTNDYIESEDLGDGHTLLVAACFDNDLEALKIFHKKGVDFTVRNHIGASTLDACAINGSIECLNYILENHIADGLINDEDPMSGFYPALYAASQNFEDCYKLLEQYGADVNMQGPYEKTEQEILQLIKAQAQ